MNRIGCFCQIVWPMAYFTPRCQPMEAVSTLSFHWLTSWRKIGLIIFSYRFFYSLLFKPATHQKYCKRCKFVASVGRPKGSPDPPPGALPPGPPPFGAYATRSANTFGTFKSRLKTELFMSAYTT